MGRKDHLSLLIGEGDLSRRGGGDGKERSGPRGCRRGSRIAQPTSADIWDCGSDGDDSRGMKFSRAAGILEETAEFGLETESLE